MLPIASSEGAQNAPLVGTRDEFFFDGRLTGKVGARSRFRLLALIWPFVAVVLAQALIASISIYTISAVRAYVGGESFWSKGQKDAVHFLTMYVDTGDVAHYDRFQRAVAVPLADRDARLALEQAAPDFDVARTGFVGGGNHPDDVPALIWLFQNFKDVSYLANAVDRWIDADPKILELAALGETIHADLSTGDATTAQIAGLKQRIHQLNAETTPLSQAFSRSLGEGSRAITELLLVANMVTAGLLILFAVWRTGMLLRQREAFESALNAERDRAETTLASIGQAVVTVDAENRLHYMNETAERLLGWRRVEAMGRELTSLFRLISEETGEEDAELMARLLRGEAVDASAVPQQLVRADMSSVAVSLVGAPLRVAGVVAGAVLVFHDRTKEQEYVAMLSWQASHDALTLLANRREFEARLQKSLDDLHLKQVVHALMYLDLDQFKLVNDTCGHAAGDELLRKTADALKQHLRPSDLLARLGGDEFGVLMENCTPEFAAETAERLRLAVETMDFAWEGRTFNISVSIGLVGLSDSGVTMEETLRGVDVACYMAKDKGRNRVQVHQTGDVEFAQRFGEMAWVQRLREAIDKDCFQLFAQEIVPLHDDEATGAHVELLLRLRDDDGSLVPPGAFIPAAERYGLMPLIDRWVVRSAFATLAKQAVAGGSSPIATCAINLSGASFGDETFVEFVREQFGQHGIAPQTICFEITETSAIADLDRAASFIAALQAFGCRFSLDDFGSGMSSFGYLKRLPVDYLKIDGGFVKDILTDRIDRAMVEMIQHIGEVTGKRTIAEFVESAAIAEILRGIGVDYAQGFGIARPRPFGSPYLAIAEWRPAAEPVAIQPQSRRRAGG